MFLFLSQHHLPNLKYVILSNSEKLTCLPDLSQSNLKILDLRGCGSLVELPPLRFQNVPHNLTTKEIKELYFKLSHHADIEVPKLDLEDCSNLKTLSVMSGNINYMSLSRTAIEELHSSIGSVNNLVWLDLKDCKCLKNLPSPICDLGSLRYLNMSGCLSIDKFPELPKNIRGLDLSGTSIEQVLPSSFECLSCLEILYMKNCTRLESLPTSICKLKSLRKLSFLGCSQLKSFPEILEPMKNLEQLDLSQTGIKDISSSIENLVMLKVLCLTRCRNLESLPTNIYNMSKLKQLYLGDCRPQNFPHNCLSSLVVLDPSGTNVVELPFCISQILLKSKCHSSHAGKNHFIFFLYKRRCTFWRHLACCECLIFHIVHHILMIQYFHNVVICELTSFLSPRIQVFLFLVLHKISLTSFSLLK